MFLFGFDMASAAKAQQQIEQSLHVKVQKCRTTFHNVCLFACCQLGLSIYWRALPSFPVLANSGRKALARPGAEGVFQLSTRRDSEREESEEGGNGYTIEEGPPGLLRLILPKK